MIVSEGDLLRLATAILTTAGASEQNAAEVAEHLIDANLSGVDTHGIWQLPGYVKDLRSGQLHGKAMPEVITAGPSHALITGNWTFGQVGANLAIRTAIDKALEAGTAVIGLVQAHHIGRLGCYIERATEAGVVALAFGGGYSEKEPVTFPHGGMGRVLHTNPIAFGAPALEEDRVMFDFATTGVSGVKVTEARRLGQALPPGAIADSRGLPSTDANDFFEGGGFLPFGGHKGYALSVAAEVLSTAFLGTDRYADDQRGGPIFGNQGVVFFATRADLFTSREDEGRRVDVLVRRLRAVPPIENMPAVLAPGDAELTARRMRSRDGILIDDDIWAGICSLPH